MTKLAEALARAEAAMKEDAKQAVAASFERKKTAYRERRDSELLSLIGPDGWRTGFGRDTAIYLLGIRRRELRGKRNVSDFTRTQRERIEIAYQAEVEARDAERSAA